VSWYCQQIGGNETSVGHDDGYVGIEGSDTSASREVMAS